MKFEMKDRTLREFKEELEKLEKSENNLNKKSEKPKFSFHCQTREELSVENIEWRIPLGNYYIIFYDYRYNKAQDNWIQLPVGCIDLKWNNKDELTHSKRFHPVFMPLLPLSKMRTGERTKEIMILTIKEALANTIIDRLKQICYSDGIPKQELLGISIDYVFKYSARHEGNKENFKLKSNNKVVILGIPHNPDNKSKSWNFHKRDNPKGNFSDALNSDRGLDIKLFKKISKYFDEKGDPFMFIESSEESGLKGTFVILNEELQKARYPELLDYSYNFKSIAFGFTKNSKDFIKTIYGNPAKMYARIKSLIGNDSAPAYISVREEKSKDKRFFERHTIYLDQEKKNQKKKNDKNTINVLTVFAPTDSLAMDMTLEEFENIDKNEYSRKLNGIDCHLPISQSIADILVRSRRTIKESITDNHLTKEFKNFRKQFDLEEIEPIIPADMVIAYKVTCDNKNCSSIMSPMEEISKDSFDITNSPTKETIDWHCYICNNDRTVEPESITIKKKYPSAKKAMLHSVEINEVETGVQIDVDVILPIDAARLVNSAGLKGYSVIYGEEHMGTVSGSIWNPDKNEYIEIQNEKVEMIARMGSMKGKHSGVAISQIQMMNATTGSNICIDEMYDKNENCDEINDILSNCKKVDYTSLQYCSKEKMFKEVTQKVHVGMMTIDVTESGEEFSKTKDEDNDMKVSYMNTLFYDWLGFHDLNNAMIHASLKSIEKDENKEFTLELLRMFNSDKGEKGKLTQVFCNDIQNDFDNKEGKLNVLSWIEKKDWNNALKHHPLLIENGKFSKGAYYQDSQGKIIVFPSRKTIMQLVDIMNGERIRLNSIITTALGLFLTIWTNKGKSLEKYQIDKYKREIFNKLTGKRGLFARNAALVNNGVSAKEVSSGYLPTGVAVVSNKKFWKMATKLMKKMGYNKETYDNGEIELYGTGQRDPFIWLFQALNCVKLWTPEKANEYFKENYKIKRFNGDQSYFSKLRFYDMYPNFKGIMINTLDMLYIYKADADGDLKRILVSFEIKAQKEMEKLNKEMENYKLICQAKPKSILGKIYRYAKNWHFDYILKEVKSSIEILPEIIELKIYQISILDRNDATLNGTENKGNISTITFSQWKIQDILDYICRNNIEINIGDKKGYLTRDDRNIIALFYQSVFTQEGCISSLKGEKDLSQCTLDEISFDKRTTWEDKDRNEHSGRIRDMVREEASEFGFEDIVDKFFGVMDHWYEIAALEEKDDNIKSNDKLIRPEAEMINAYVSLTNGSKFSYSQKSNPFKRLTHSYAEKMFQRELMRPVVDYLKSLPENPNDAKANRIIKQNSTVIIRKKK